MENNGYVHDVAKLQEHTAELLVSKQILQYYTLEPLIYILHRIVKKWCKLQGCKYYKFIAYCPS
jgi:hypothetical protein